MIVSEGVYRREVEVPGTLIRRDTLQAVASMAEALAGLEAKTNDGVHIRCAALRVEQISGTENGTRRFLVEWPSDKVDAPSA